MGHQGPLETPALRVKISSAFLEKEAFQDSQGQRDSQGLQAPLGLVLLVQQESEGPLGTLDLKDSLAHQGQRALEVTLSTRPVHPKTLVPPDRKEILEIQVTRDFQVLQVLEAPPDLMDLKETKDSMVFLDHLDNKVPQVLLEIQETKDPKASVMVGIQALRGSQALLDSGAQQETLMSGPQEPLASQGH